VWRAQTAAEQYAASRQALPCAASWEVRVARLVHSLHLLTASQNGRC
jgi:hypothetical protein